MPPRTSLDYIRKNAQTFAHAGSVVATYRTRGTKRFGPYYRLAYRSAGCQRSIYLGRSPQMAQQVRNLLAKLQHPHRHQRQLRRDARRRKATLLAIKRQWQQAARNIGLYTRGWDVRGWRARGYPRFSTQAPRRTPQSGSSDGFSANHLPPPTIPSENRRCCLQQEVRSSPQSPTVPLAPPNVVTTLQRPDLPGNRQKRPPVDQLPVAWISDPRLEPSPSPPFHPPKPETGRITPLLTNSTPSLANHTTASQPRGPPTPQCPPHPDPQKRLLFNNPRTIPPQSNWISAPGSP